jgi:hypothetical protein
MPAFGRRAAAPVSTATPMSMPLRAEAHRYRGWPAPDEKLIVQHSSGNCGGRELLREGQSLLRQLDLPLPCSVAALRGRIQQARGRPLIILPLPYPAGEECPYGLWAEYPDADFILHEARTSPAHQDQIILHEITHILLGHGTVASLTSRASRVSPQTAPGLRRRMPAAMQTRLAYGTAEERQAEIIASLLMMRTPSTAGRRTWERRDLVALRPLWSTLTGTAPHVVLSPLLTAADDPRIDGADLQLRLWRCIVETRDAELLLRGYVSDASAATARTALAETGLGGKELEAAAEAAWLRAATAIRRAGHPPERPGPTRPLHGGSGLAEEVGRLLLVTAAWDSPAVLSAAAEVTRFCESGVPDGSYDTRT